VAQNEQPALSLGERVSRSGAFTSRSVTGEGFLPSRPPHRSRQFVVCSLAMEWKNRLYFGDNLDILRREVPDSSVDLIYLDPPFNSNATYNVLFKEKSGEESAAQITAFEDTWQWSVEAEAVYKEIVTDGPNRLGTGIQFRVRALGWSLPESRPMMEC